MRDNDCIDFLQWALPKMHMRWPGFRKVRAQVCKRIDKHLSQLGVHSLEEYQHYLIEHKEEWIELDALSRVTISRFYRDKMMFEFLEQQVLPTLAQQLIARDEKYMKVWCIGFGSGEEPYTIMLIWILQLQSRFPGLKLQILATDSSPQMKQRAFDARYPYSAIKNLPREWQEKCFKYKKKEHILKPEYKKNIRFQIQDIRDALPREKFDLVFCRNLVFTYFAEPLQSKILKDISDTIIKGGVLVLGIHEHLPEPNPSFKVWSERFKIYQKVV